MPELRLSAREKETLDWPILSALKTTQRHLSRGGRLAIRYPGEIAPFAALLEETPQARRELREIAGRDFVALFYPAPLEPPAVEGLDVKLAAKALQMVATDIPAADPAFAPEPLGPADVPEMLELTARTKPGPFSARTHELGRYIGIRTGGRLAAMAGERMRPEGFTEISAVCVHPDFRGQGHAQALVAALMASIAARGERPFLHLYADNTAAHTLYERLGFAVRAEFNFAAIQAP